MAHESRSLADRDRMRRFVRLGRGALGAAFSIGPGYEVQPPGTRARYDRVTGYYLDLRKKAAAPLRLRMTGHGETMAPGPTALAQRALGFHESWIAGDESARETSLNAAETLLARAQREDDALLWRYDVDVPRYAQVAPWYSAMAQGQAASAFVRAYGMTLDAHWADAALAAVEPLITHRWRLVAPTDAGPVLEEVATTPPSRVLNGWIFALWGLWDVGVALRDLPAQSLFTESAAALASTLPEYDVGWWTRYSLYPPIAPDLAKPFYHALHVAQMPALYRMTEDPVFAEAAARWRSYDTAMNRVRAVTAKAVPVIRSSFRPPRRQPCTRGE